MMTDMEYTPEASRLLGTPHRYGRQALLKSHELSGCASTQDLWIDCAAKLSQTDPVPCSDCESKRVVAFRIAFVKRVRELAALQTGGGSRLQAKQTKRLHSSGLLARFRSRSATRLYAASAALMLSACGSTPWHGIKANVVIGIGDEQFSGNGIWKTRVVNNPLTSFAEIPLLGDAIVINLGRHGTIYALPRGGLEPPGSSIDAVSSLPDSMRRQEDGAGPGRPSIADRPAYRTYVLEVDDGKMRPICLPRPTNLIEGTCLTLVRFSDPSRPESLEVLDPRNLARSLGPNVSLVLMSIGVTRQSPTVSDLSLLPWIGTRKGPLSGQALSSRYPVFFEDFRRSYS